MRESSFFTAEEMSLPSVARQVEETEAGLYGQAERAHGQMMEWLDRGRGLDRLLGMKLVVLDPDDPERCVEEVEACASAVVEVPDKGRERAREKVETDYDGDWARLVDVVRSSMVFGSLAGVAEAVQEMRASGMVLARRPQDGFASPPASGCRRLKANVVLPGGHIGEVQVHLGEIFKAAVRGHGMYERLRGIGAAAKAEGRAEMTVEERREAAGLSRAVREAYEAAWRRCGGAVTASAGPALFSSGATERFAVGGWLASVVPGRFPEVFVGGRRTVVYDLARFADKAFKVSMPA